MPRYIVATINDHHVLDTPIEWRDGERHTFLHGAEFELPESDALSIFEELKNIGRTTLQITTDTHYFPEYGFGVSTITSSVEDRLNTLLGRTHDERNPSVYVTKNHLARFTAGDVFEIAELVLAQSMDDGSLVECRRLKLRGYDQERHAIDEYAEV
jgi:hypothetical protein